MKNRKMVNMAGQYNIVDLFAGVGGLSMGFDKNGFSTVLANDFDKDASNTFKLNHPKVNFIDGDIANIDKAVIEKNIGNIDVDVLMGGIPCQSFSMAGRRIRRGIDNSEDPRHFLYREYFRILDLLNPKIALIENVKGILSSHNGEIIKEIIFSFESRGYKADYKLLDASDYGVPQARQRVVVIANRINKENIFPDKHNQKISVGEAIDNIPEGVENHEKRYLTGKTLERVKLIKQGQNWTHLPEKLQTRSIHSGAYGRIDPTKPSKTITTRFDTPSVGYVTHPTEHRTLTVREGARIQTFPDNFIFTGPRMQQYKQVGNAVPVKLGYELSKGLKKMLDTFYENQPKSRQNKASPGKHSVQN